MLRRLRWARVRKRLSRRGRLVRAKPRVRLDGLLHPRGRAQRRDLDIHGSGSWRPRSWTARSSGSEQSGRSGSTLGSATAGVRRHGSVTYWPMNSRADGVSRRTVAEAELLRVGRNPGPSVQLPIPGRVLSPAVTTEPFHGASERVDELERLVN
jgi:hypothetical protein